MKINKGCYPLLDMWIVQNGSQFNIGEIISGVSLRGLLVYAHGKTMDRNAVITECIWVPRPAHSALTQASLGIKRWKVWIQSSRRQIELDFQCVHQSEGSAEWWANQLDLGEGGQVQLWSGKEQTAAGKREERESVQGEGGGKVCVRGQWERRRVQRDQWISR